MNSPSLLFPLVLVWLAFGALTAWVAAQKKKPIFNWFLSGVFFGPLALLAVSLPSRINPALPARWSYLILAMILGVVIWLGWKTLYAD